MCLSTSYPVTLANGVNRGANEGPISIASHYQQVIYQITHLITLNQKIHSMYFYLNFYYLPMMKNVSKSTYFQWNGKCSFRLGTNMLMHARKVFQYHLYTNWKFKPNLQHFRNCQPMGTLWFFYKLCNFYLNHICYSLLYQMNSLNIL